MSGERNIPVKINPDLTIYTDSKKKIPAIMKRYKKYIDHAYVDAQAQQSNSVDDDSVYAKDHQQEEEPF